MYTASDPRSALAPAAKSAGTPTALAPASYCRFYETPPQEEGPNGKVWYARGANFLVAHTEAAEGGTFSRRGQIDEWAIIVPDRETRLEIETPAGKTAVEPYSIVFVPPGDSTVRVPTGGRIVRLFSTRSADLAARCQNAAAYASPPPNLPPFQPWPDPVGGFKVRTYSLDVGGETGRFGRIFRCTTLMINYLDPRQGPRDIAKLSPHHHDDFEQGSLVLDGEYVHDIRWPWTPNMAIWREDEHARCGAPSLTVIPPPTVHTSRSIDLGLNQMVDLFSPPRMDFSEKPGWVLNAADYPMPGPGKRADAMSSEAELRAAQVERLLVGAVDLHCHSGPAVMPRILDHHDALIDAAAAGFKAVVYKDHYYPGMAHAAILEKLFKDRGVRLFSGIVLNNATGGWNPHAVDHTIRLGGKIVWLPTVSAANHIAHVETGKTKTFPKTSQPMLDQTPMSAVDANGRLLDPVKQILDLIAEGDVLLAGGHLPVAEQHLVFAEAKARGVMKMLVNHPTYMVGASDADMRDLAAMGVAMEHSICMFVEGRSKRFSDADLKHLIDIAGAGRTILSSDLGLVGSVRPVEGYRAIVEMLLNLQVTEADIRRLISSNAAAMLGLE